MEVRGPGGALLAAGVFEISEGHNPHGPVVADLTARGRRAVEGPSGVVGTITLRVDGHPGVVAWDARLRR